MNKIEKLDSRGVCYAVVQSTAKMKYSDNIVSDWFVITLAKDTDGRIMKNWRVEESFTRLDKKFIKSYTMSREDSRYFVSNLNQYELVIDNEFGKVYELKGNSFKSYFSAFLDDYKQKHKIYKELTKKNKKCLKIKINSK